MAIHSMQNKTGDLGAYLLSDLSSVFYLRGEKNRRGTFLSSEWGHLKVPESATVSLDCILTQPAMELIYRPVFLPLSPPPPQKKKGGGGGGEKKKK